MAAGLGSEGGQFLAGGDASSRWRKPGAKDVGDLDKVAVVTHRALSPGCPRTGFSIAKKFRLGVANLKLADLTGAERRKARRTGKAVIDSAPTRLTRRCRRAAALTHAGQGSQTGVGPPGWGHATGGQAAWTFRLGVLPPSWRACPYQPHHKMYDMIYRTDMMNGCE